MLQVKTLHDCRFYFIFIKYTTMSREEQYLLVLWLFESEFKNFKLEINPTLASYFFLL